MRLPRWLLLAPLIASCAVGADPVLDGGPISGRIDVVSDDLGGVDDPLDAPRIDEEADVFDVGAMLDDRVDAPPRQDHVDAPVIVDLGGCRGECAPGEGRACGNCGRQTCTASCAWGPCAGEGVCAPSASRACGNCGRQTCTASCAWGACTGGGVCAPGQRRSEGCDGCSEQVCSAACQWSACQLRAGMTCEYRGGRNNRACSRCRCGLQWCLPSCQWSTDCLSCCTTCGGCL